MAWSETMFIIQHFYNALDINNQMETLENKIPILSPSVNGLPELETGMTVNDLTPGVLWFIEDSINSNKIIGLTILQNDYTFADVIPFSIDMNNVNIESDIQTLLTTMNLTADTYHDLMKVLLQLLNPLGVVNGGTGATTLPKGEVLVGQGTNAVTTIPIDTSPTKDSGNPVSSGAVYKSVNSLNQSIATVSNEVSENSDCLSWYVF